MSLTTWRPIWIASSSDEAQYLPSRYSRTKTGTLTPTLIRRTRSLRTTLPAKTRLTLSSSGSRAGDRVGVSFIIKPQGGQESPRTGRARNPWSGRARRPGSIGQSSRRSSIATLAGRPGSMVTVLESRSNSASTAIPASPTCSPPAIRTGRTATGSRSKRSRVFDGHAERAVVQDLRHALQAPVAFRTIRLGWGSGPKGEHRDNHLLQADPSVMVGKIAPGAEDSDAGGEEEVEVGVVAQLGPGDADRPRRVGTSAADPAAAMDVDRVAARIIGAKRLVFLAGELVAVIGRDNDRVDSSSRELAHGAGDVLEHGVHHLTRDEVAVHLAELVDLLRADDDELGVADRRS